MIIIGTASAYKCLIKKKTWNYICKTDLNLMKVPIIIGVY